MLEQALSYARVGWRVQPLHNIGSDGFCTCRSSNVRPKAHQDCPSPGKHPRIKTGRAFEAATTDEAQIRKWWKKWPLANIGIATGQASRLCVVDIDGQKGFDTLMRVAPLCGPDGIPATLMARSGREGIGAHLYFTCDEPSPSNSGDGLDIRGDGGNLVAPPSMHISGHPYAWFNTNSPAPMPPTLLHWFQNRDREARQRVKTREDAGAERSVAPPDGLPEHLRGRAGAGLSRRPVLAELPAIADVESALEAIPNVNRSWDEWNRIGMAVWRATDGSEAGLEAFDYWAQKSAKYQAEGPEERWRAYVGSPPDSIGYGSLFYEAKQADPAWSPPSQARAETIPAEMQAFQPITPDQRPAMNGHHLNGHAGPAALLFTPKSPDNPLIELNEKHAVIGNLGGKCLVLDWVPSAVDEKIKLPSFQTFNAFTERYGHRYLKVDVKKKNGDTEEESKPLGRFWLNWPHRKSYENIGMEPGADTILPGNILNLWKGLAVDPKPGSWARMQAHITDILADGDPESASYILRFAAWCLQHPGERAEVAMVFRGEKGSGKGTFARAIKDIFGQHGLHIYSSRHLTGNFNAHLRTCLLLFADEAFWAGDKQGEATFKGLVTEPTTMIEQKGIDAVQWPNRLKVIMAANADWAVPASSRERRYAVFNVSDRRVKDRPYFDAINQELAAGGLAAMAHDLLALDLGAWHPRAVVETKALLEQKRHSLQPVEEWFCNILEDGIIPGGGADTVAIEALFHTFREGWPHARGSREIIGKLLSKWGCGVVRSAKGNLRRFPPLSELRAKWAKAYGGEWPWEHDVAEWVRRA